MFLSLLCIIRVIHRQLVRRQRVCKVLGSPLSMVWSVDWKRVCPMELHRAWNICCVPGEKQNNAQWGTAIAHSAPQITMWTTGYTLYIGIGIIHLLLHLRNISTQVFNMNWSIWSFGQRALTGDAQGDRDSSQQPKETTTSASFLIITLSAWLWLVYFFLLEKQDLSKTFTAFSWPQPPRIPSPV